MEIRRVTADEREALRGVRLRALADAPDAFGTTLDEATARPDSWWTDWAERSAASETQAMFLAWEGAQAVGIAGVFHHDGVWQVISMWVERAARGRGVGQALLDAAVAFADGEVRLSVTDGIGDARRLYERYGFVDTGDTEPLRSNPALTIRELRLER
jgi:ribosomal protein S18 acetylase RimI-like enzyme